MLEAHFLALAKTGLTKQQKAISGVRRERISVYGARNKHHIRDRRTGKGEVSTQQLEQIEVPQSAPAGSGLRGMQESSQDRKCDC